MAIVEGYFDESGALEEAPGIFCVSGYFIGTNAAKQMHTDWIGVLDRYQLDFFHMVDCAHGTEGFRHLTKSERIQVETELIGLIKKYTLEGFSILASAESYAPMLDAPDVYSDCVAGCVQAVQTFLQFQRVQGDVAYFFEAGHGNRHDAYGYIARRMPRQIDSITFGSKVKFPLLQAADLLAWQSVKYAKDWFYPTLRKQPPIRPPRKDFQSLTEHPHMFAHMGANGKKGHMGIEMWPVSRRSQRSQNVKMHETLAITHWIDEGDTLPIIPVEGTTGAKLGRGRMIYVKFNGLMGQPFALSFDEPRLFEAVTMFVRSTGAFEMSANIPIFTAEDVQIVDQGSVSLLSIKLHKGATIVLHLPENVLARLKTDLSR